MRGVGVGDDLGEDGAFGDGDADEGNGGERRDSVSRIFGEPFGTGYSWETWIASGLYSRYGELTLQPPLYSLGRKKKQHA